MIVVLAGVKVHLAFGYADMRKALDGLATLTQENLKKDLFSGHLFVCCGKNASLWKFLFWDGAELVHQAHTHQSFLWPHMAEPGGTVTHQRNSPRCSNASIGAYGNAFSCHAWPAKITLKSHLSKWKLLGLILTLK
ncbi:MAG: IS66 family insertion sequence element accessory protein TnpB [Methylovirgula sp.]